MAITTNFFNDGTTVYQAEDFIRPWNTLLSPGVFGDSGFKIGATSPASLAVQVTDGKAINGGYFVASDAVETVEITANTSGYNRLDIIVIEIDTTNMKTLLKDVQGIPSSSPVAPNLQGNQIALAQVLVGNNASVIDSNVITDMRRSTVVYNSPIGGTSWWKDPNTGIIMQWGVLNNVYGSGMWINYPVAFPHEVVSVQLTNIGSGDPGLGLIADYSHLDMLEVGTTQNGTNYFYFAIGY